MVALSIFFIFQADVTQNRIYTNVQGLEKLLVLFLSWIQISWTYQEEQVIVQQFWSPSRAY